jgi:hypothetical protein
MAGQSRAAKVTPPRKRATTPAASELIEPTPPLPDKQPANARTRTSTRGAENRTATVARARTAAAASTVEPEIPPPPPAEEPGTPDAGPTPDGVEEMPEADVEWNGRTWRVRLPSLEQLTIYRRLNAKFQEIGQAQAKPDAQPMSLETATKYFDRALKLITSILVNADDIEWLEDEMLENRLTLTAASGLMRKAFDELGRISKEREAANENRTARRARARLAD